MTRRLAPGTALTGRAGDNDRADRSDALVFTSPQGAPLRNSNFRRQVWYQAVE